MKKLIMFAVAAALVCATQAATVKWTTGTVKLPGSTTTMSASNTTLYFWAESLSDPWGSVKVTSTGEGSAAIYTVAASDATQTYRSGGATITPSSASYGKDDTAYGAVIITYDATGDGKIGVGDYYMIGTGSYTLLSDVNITQSLAMGSWTKIEALTPPTPVDPGDGPEPTSGLLLAVGGAMLALRRKRA